MPCRVAPPQGECGEGEEEAEICSSEEQEKRKRRREKKRTIKKEQREKRMGCRRGYMHCVQCGEQASTHMFVPSLLNDATLLRPRTAQTSYALKSKGVLPPATFQPPASGGGRHDASSTALGSGASSLQSPALASPPSLATARGRERQSRLTDSK
jgi:hypothetical protein